MPASTNAMTADNATAAPESAPRLSVSLVGRLGVRFNGRTIELRTRKAGAVLSYLALLESKQESRERLVGLLWSRSPAGLPVDVEQVNQELERRQWGYGRGGRMKIERDRVEILSGVRHGLTLGSPLAKVGVQLTDSIYVALSMGIMTRMGAAAWEQLGSADAFTRCCSIRRSSTGGCSKGWTISTRRSGSGCWPSGRPSMNG